MSVDNTNDEKQVLTKPPIETAKPTPSSAVPVVVTRTPVYI